MFNNVNAKKRLTQVIVAFVIICMTLTGSFLLLEDTISTAYARDEFVSTQGEWNNFMSQAKSGETWNLTLDSNIALTGVTGGKFAAVPAGVTVNLNMNNFSITWDYMQNGGDWNGNLMATSYTSGTYASGEYWGLLTNNGTLNIQGTGTIRNKKIHITGQKEDRNNAVQKLATIVNSGNLTVGGNVTVEAYLTSVHNSDDSWSTASYSDNYIYDFGIYSSAGTVNSSAKIYVGGMAGYSQTGTSGRAYNLCYGIYGNGSTKVNVTGGNVYVDSFSGGFMETGSGYNAHVYASAVGVFGNNTIISGNTTINVLTKGWRAQDQNSNTWRDGIDHNFSAGVMYTGANYPVIGPSVDVVASFEHIGNNKTQVYVPGAGDGAYSWSGVYSEGGSNNTNHFATPVVGVSGTNNNIGTHTSETDFNAKFFGETTPTASAKSYAYKTAQSYYANTSATVTAPQVNNSNNDSTRMTAAIVNGAPGNTGSGGLTNSNIGNPGAHSPAASGFKKGSQYLVVYRFYKDINNPESVSFAYDSSKIASEAVINVGAASNDKSGLVPDGASKVAYASGAASKLPKFYSFKGAYYETVESANAGLAERLNNISSGKAQTPKLWAGGKTPLDAGGIEVSTSKDNTFIVYLDYELLDPTSIDIVAANKGVPITDSTTTTSFTVAYTGAPLKPGTDFNLGILDVAYDYKNVVEEYNYKNETGSSKTSVSYRYSSNGGATWTDGLPTDAGDYEIEVNVRADTTVNNRQAKTAKITGKITPATVTISRTDGNVITGTYGSSYNDLFNSFKDFKLTNNGNAANVSGTWSIRGVALTDIPKATTHSLTVVWTPDASIINNYGVATYDVSLVVNQRAVTVNAGTATVTYGDAAPSFNIKYSNLATADESKQAGWLASTVFEVFYNGTWRDYYQGLPAGTYDLRIKADAFGGATDTNNKFTINTATDKLTVEKRAIKYTATATDKTYDGQINVAVKLSNPANNYTPDVFDTTINTTGTMVNANAGANKAVTVKTENVTIPFENNYYLVIVNADSLTVNVAKADPTGVSVVAKPAVVTYDKAKTLASVALDATANANIPGTWAWEAASTVPTVSKTSYVAVFTPKDTTNYNNLKQNVNLTVEKADVEVTVAPITVTYGDSVPVLKVVYSGFTGGDTLESIVYEGNTEVSTDYTPGSGVGKAYTISVNTNITSENYNFIKKNSTIAVNPKALTVTANDATITYGDPKPEFDASDVTATGFYGSDTLNTINATVNVTTTYLNNAEKGFAGEHTISATVSTTNKNYTITCVPGTLTVEKAVVTITPKQKTIQYGTAKPTYTVSDADCFFSGFKYGQTISSITVEGAPDFITTYEVGSYVNPSYPVTVEIGNMKSANYTFVGATGSIKVTKADLNVTTIPTASVVNSHSLADAVFSDTAVVVNKNNSAMNVAGKFTFNDSTAVPEWNSTDSYAATFTPTDDYNYNTVTVNVKVTVTVKEISGIPVIQGSAMEGSTLSVNLASMDPTTASSYTYQWYVGNTAVATTATYEVKNADIGKTIYVVLDAVEANGFTGTATSANTDAVIKALLETTVAQLKVNLPTGVVYDAMPHAGTVAIADGYNPDYFGTPVLKYNGSSKAPTAAGTYIVTVDVSTPDEPAGGYPENTYYGPATGIVVGEITIARAPYTITVLADDKVYDGTVTATATITGSGLKDENDVVYLAEGVRYAFDDANVGTDKTVNVSNITLIGEHATNYEAVVEPTTASITPATLTVRATGVNKTYDGTATVGVTFSNITGYAPVDSASTVYLVNGTATAASVNAGENILISNITYELAGSSKGNYVVAISNKNTATVTINKAPVSVDSPVINGIVYDSTKPLSTIDLSGFSTEDGYWQFTDVTIVPTVKQKTYSATYFSKNPNYEDETPGTITVNVTPKEVTLKADDKSVTYGSNAPTYTITATGFTGTDSLAMIGGNIAAVSTYAPGSDIGSYTITINEALTRDNYTFKTETGNLTVSHGLITVTAAAKDRVYNGSSNVTVNFTIDSGVYAADDVRLSYASVTGTAKTANAGTSTVTYAAPVLVGEKAKNYQINVTPKSGVLTVVIAKADVTGVEFPTNATVEFGYDLSYVVFGEPGVGDGTFAYENAKQVVPGGLGVYDGYKVIFTPTDSTNYNTQEAFVSLQVIKCVLDYTVGIAGNPQSGQTLTVVTTNLPVAALSYMTYQWYRIVDGQYVAIKGADDKSYVATDDDIGYTLAVRTAVMDGSPFVYAEGADVEEIGDIMGFVGTTTDAIKEITLTFWQRLMNWLYRILAILTGIQLGGGLLGGE